MLKSEYINEQTELLSKFLQTILFPTTSNVELENYKFYGAILEAQLKLMELIGDLKFNEAENFVFDLLEQDNGQEILQMAVWFYDKLNKFDEKTLSDNNFSHEEILEGLKEIEKMACA